MDISETAIASEKDQFIARVNNRLQHLTQQLSQLASGPAKADSQIRALQADKRALAEDVNRLDKLNAVAYRHRHQPLQDRLYTLEAEVTAVHLNRMQSKAALQEAARRQLTALGREIKELARFMERKGPSTKNDQAVDLAQLNMQLNRLESQLAALQESSSKTPFVTAREDLSKGIAQLMVTLRKARDQVQYPELENN